MDQKRLLEKLDQKVDKLDEKVDTVNLHLAVYNEQLKIHIEGTVQNRDAILVLQKELRPLQDNHVKRTGMMEYIGYAAVFAGLLAGLKELFF